MTESLDRAHYIREQIEVNVLGYMGAPACAEAWATAKLIAKLEGRVKALEAARPAEPPQHRRPWAAMSFRGAMLLPPPDCEDPDLWIAERIYEMGFADGQDATTSERACDAEALEAARRAALSEPDPTPTVRHLTVQDCNNMRKHERNQIGEAFQREIALYGLFTREDLIEIASTAPPND